MLFTIKNDFAIVRLRKKSNIIRLIKKSRYRMYAIGSKLRKIDILFNRHISHSVRMNFLDYQSLVSMEYSGRIEIARDTDEDIYYIKRVFERSSAYKIVQECMHIYYSKKYNYSF